ncbi:GntR family transcriptional regulator [Oceanobacillus iheyensis]|uniref:GntR family transcriptional regulator n=1 Tax=Oceanobacillus picturae TaxID=171693 RepID=UPI000D1212AA|nr:GntR family transcriptional regulator [Oceanobacillus iheyensis]
MRAVLDESQPIFQQIADMIRDDIIDREFKENEKVPSENELSQFYNINRATVRKGLQQLLDENLIYKKRGIGMFVKEGARESLVKERQKQYVQDYIKPLLDEGNRLGLNVDSIIQLMKEETK